ncbi:hypothetical protein Dsin_029835 [Dipteronia sinensis]|uniref:Uncharacterized protein n=1 Tax=Dipteronia sinensis TaxID=43782 RepID=A0AAD9ZTU4_9ROSI|nr:hypothetical protein Dsin_029835 [Dipteronia sinensis]
MAMLLEKLAMKPHRLSSEAGRIDIDQWKGHSLGVDQCRMKRGMILTGVADKSYYIFFLARVVLLLADCDPYIWPDSKWRRLKVSWDSGQKAFLPSSRWFCRLPQVSSNAIPRTPEAQQFFSFTLFPDENENLQLKIGPTLEYLGIYSSFLASLPSKISKLSDPQFLFDPSLLFPKFGMIRLLRCCNSGRMEPFDLLLQMSSSTNWVSLPSDCGRSPVRSFEDSADRSEVSLGIQRYTLHRVQRYT